MILKPVLRLGGRLTPQERPPADARRAQTINRNILPARGRNRAVARMAKQSSMAIESRIESISSLVASLLKPDQRSAVERRHELRCTAGWSKAMNVQPIAARLSETRQRC